MRYLIITLLLASCTPTNIPKANCPYPCPTAINHLSREGQMAWFHKQQDKNRREMKRKGQWIKEPSGTITVIQETP